MLAGELALASDTGHVFVYNGSAKVLVGKSLTGAIGSRPAAAWAGRFYYATDEGQLYLDTGSAWAQIGAAKVSALIGNGAAISFTITPGFSTEACVVQVSNASTGVLVMPPKITIGYNSNTQVRLDFPTGDIPTTNQFRVVILG